MARVTEVTESGATGAAREIFDESLRQFGRVSNFSKVMGNSPPALAAWMTANRGVRLRYLDEDPEFLRIEQLVIIKTSSANDSQYCLTHNVELGAEAGLVQEQIHAVQQEDYESSPVLTDRHKAAVRWAVAVTSMQARDDEALFTEMQKHFTDEQIVELTVLVGMWNFSNRFCEALHIEVEPEGQRLSFSCGVGGRGGE